MNDSTNQADSDLWLISVKLRGLAHLIQDQRRESFPSRHNEGTYGIGEILIDLADQILRVHECLETPAKR